MHKEILKTLDVSCETINRLEIYVDILLKWNKKINLISKNTIPNIWTRHILDSAQLMKFLENKTERIIDIGSGAGLPGIVLSIMGAEAIVLVESDERKVSFLREVSRILGLGVEVINDRVENISIEANVILARGFSALDKIFDITSHIHYNRMLLLKGQNAEFEIDNAYKEWEFSYIKHKSITNID